MSTVSREEILSGVIECVAESLALENEKEKIHEGSLLFEELGADSVDTMDIMFRLEEKFTVKLRKEDFNFLTKTGIDIKEAIVEGQLTDEAKQKLSRWLPRLPTDQSLALADLARYVSIGSLVTLVEENLPNGGVLGQKPL